MPRSRLTAEAARRNAMTCLRTFGSSTSPDTRPWKTPIWFKLPAAASMATRPGACGLTLERQRKGPGANSVAMAGRCGKAQMAKFRIVASTPAAASFFASDRASSGVQMISPATHSTSPVAVSVFTSLSWKPLFILYCRSWANFRPSENVRIPILRLRIAASSPQSSRRQPAARAALNRWWCRSSAPQRLCSPPQLPCVASVCIVARTAGYRSTYWR